jgi:hypothetical protein
MRHDTIAEIEIDGDGRLHVVPTAHTFPYIYREGVEVNWDDSRRSLHSPKPREWSYARWFSHILATASSQGCELQVAPGTRWLNIDPGTKAEVLQAIGNGA